VSAGSLARLGVRCYDASSGIATLGINCGAPSTTLPSRLGSGLDDGDWERDEMDVLDICSIIIMSGVLDG